MVKIHSVTQDGLILIPSLSRLESLLPRGRGGWWNKELEDPSHAVLQDVVDLVFYVSSSKSSKFFFVVLLILNFLLEVF